MWYNVESTTQPSMIDTTTSRNWIYVRKDIHTEEREDEVTGEKMAVWVWKEIKIARENWELYKAVERNTANIDYIAMMSDIEIEEDKKDE